MTINRDGTSTIAVPKYNHQLQYIYLILDLRGNIIQRLMVYKIWGLNEFYLLTFLSYKSCIHHYEKTESFESIKFDPTLFYQLYNSALFSCFFTLIKYSHLSHQRFPHTSRQITEILFKTVHPHAQMPYTLQLQSSKLLTHRVPLLCRLWPFSQTTK